MMSKEVILEKPEHIVIYKIVEYYKQIKRKDIIELTKKIYKDLFEREVSDDAVINWIREITGFREEYNEQTRNRELKPVKDKRKKLGILKVRSGGIYEIANVSVKPANKNIWDEVDRYLKLRKENRIISDELRVKHTERIRERIIGPWKEWLICGDSRLDGRKYEFRTFEEIKGDPLYKDLDNHIPAGLENPKEIVKYIEEKEKEFDKLKRELGEKLKSALTEILKENGLRIREGDDDIGWSPLALAGALVGIIQGGYNYYSRYLKFEEVRKRITVNRVVNVHGKVEYNGHFGIWIIVRENEEIDEENMAKEICKIFNDNRIIKLAIEYGEKLSHILKEINNNKNKLIEILEELETYEILPGVCKYLRGD